MMLVSETNIKKEDPLLITIFHRFRTNLLHFLLPLLNLHHEPAFRPKCDKGLWCYFLLAAC